MTLVVETIFEVFSKDTVFYNCRTNFKERFGFGKHKLLDVILDVDGYIVAKKIRECN